MGPPLHRDLGPNARCVMPLAGELGDRPVLARIHLGLGRLYRRTGTGAKAQEHLTTAATMFREMDMGFWLEKATAEFGPPQQNAP